MNHYTQKNQEYWKELVDIVFQHRAEKKENIIKLMC